MTNIAEWAERPLPIDAAEPVASARGRFLEQPGLSALAVVEQGAPVGVVSRTMVMACNEAAATAQQPVRAVMAAARCMAADTPSAEAFGAVLAGGGCAEPYLLTAEGRYAGLLTETGLLQALQGRASREAAQEEDRTRFVEMLSREVRTPMTGVLAVAELLQRQPLTADAQAYVQTIVDTSETLLRLLDDSLDLAMGETGRLEATPEPVQLRAMMDGVQEEWQQRQSAGVAVLVSYDGDPDLAVSADGQRVRQVFNNLIAAAAKTTRRGAVEASLKARETAEGVLLEGRVRDAGAGLPPEQLARIFEPSSQSGYGGRSGWGGLGPALCRRILEAMNGSIRAESNVGEGVTVTFEFMAPRLEAAPEAREQSHLNQGAAVHVLVVDDNATNRMVAEGLCEMFDCTSECAEDGVEAVEAARSGRFDLILMDIKMPRMDGMEATRAIRALPGAAGQVPIIALTANADPDDARTYIACGMSSVVEKPIKPERLLAAMSAALDGDPAEAPVETTRAA